MRVVDIYIRHRPTESAQQCTAGVFECSTVFVALSMLICPSSKYKQLSIKTSSRVSLYIHVRAYMSCNAHTHTATFEITSMCNPLSMQLQTGPSSFRGHRCNETWQECDLGWESDLWRHTSTASTPVYLRVVWGMTYFILSARETMAVCLDSVDQLPLPCGPCAVKQTIPKPA